MTKLRAINPEDAYYELCSFFDDRHDSDDGDEVLETLKAVRQGGVIQGHIDELAEQLQRSRDVEKWISHD